MSPDIGPTRFLSAQPSLKRRRTNGFHRGHIYRGPKRQRTGQFVFHHEPTHAAAPVENRQKALVLLGPKQRYSLTESHPVPEVKKEHELLVKVQCIGLNPIDWKAPDFGFGIPELPYIAGRDIVGVVVKEASQQSRVKLGDVVFSASTDYRDFRKAAYQQFAVASTFNVCRIPETMSRNDVAGLGVAFIAAALALGVCFGCDFSGTEYPSGPNLRRLLRSIDPQVIPHDVRGECLDSEDGAPRRGDWIAVWGGSSATARIVAQLSKLIGLRVIKVVDVGKHGEHLATEQGDLLVDNHDPDRAIEVIKAVTKNKLRFGIDTGGTKTAELLQRALSRAGNHLQSHLVGLTGLPKDEAPGTKHHTVPIKIHHEVQLIGETLMTWLERLLQEEKISPPDTELAPGGLESINEALDRMRAGQISGKRLVVPVDK